MRLTVTAASLLVAGLVATPAFAGPKWEVGDDAWLSLAFLGQVHYSHMDDADQKNDFFLRRGRFILAGQVMDGVKFFVETDNDNAGKAGSDVSTDIQDAFADVRIGHSDHWVEAGLILLPFSFENKSSAAKLLGHDYNSEVIKLVNTFVWRDYGVEVHGNAGTVFAYRIGVFDGYDAKGGKGVTNPSSAEKDPDAELRYTGHLAVNVLGAVETGWFMTQERFEGTYLSLGAGADYQKDATRSIANPADSRDSTNWVVDFQSGFELSPVHLTVNGAWYLWDNANFDGSTAFVEAGALMDKVMLLAKYTYQDENNNVAKAARGDLHDYTAGVHYFMKRHNARAGIEYRWGESDDQILAGLQFLL